MFTSQQTLAYKKTLLIALFVGGIALVGGQYLKDIDAGRQLASVGDNPSTIYVSPSGDDANDGSSGSPVATIDKALTLFNSQSNPGTIYLKGGTYTLTKTVAIKPSSNTASLTIQAAPGETPVIDGGSPVTPTPMEGEQGMFLIDGTFTANLPGIWDENARARYNTVADLASAKATDYSMYYYSPTQVAIHPLGGALSSGIRISLLDYGFDITRSNVSITGITFRGFSKSYSSAGIKVGATQDTPKTDNIIIANSRFENSYSGIFFQRGTGVGSSVTNSTFRDDCSGINQWGGNVTIEHNDFRNDDSPSNLFAFKDPSPMTGATGILAYYNSNGGNYKFNLVNGFLRGISIKTVDPSNVADYPFLDGIHPFIIEHNTIIDDPNLRLVQGVNDDGVRHVRYGNYGKDKSVTRYNIINGFTIPIAYDANLSTSDATIDKNIFWSSGHFAGIDYAQKIKDAGMGDNIVADPLFMDASGGDYRLMANSPAVGITDDGQPVGAFGATNVSNGPVAPTLSAVATYVSLKQYSSKTYPNTYDIATSTLSLTLTPSTSVTSTKISITSKTSGSEIYSDTHPYVSPDYIPAPTDQGQYTVTLSVQDSVGTWSKSVTVNINRVSDTANFDSPGYVKANMYGFVVFNKNSQNQWQYISYRKKGSTDWIKGFDTLNYQNTYTAPYNDMRNVGEQPMIVTGLEPNTTYEYKITPRTNIVSPTYEVTTSGSPTTYYVSSNGSDAREGGSRNAPLKTLQYAIDLSLPGDNIRLLPGVYFGPFVMFHSGVPGHPITIEADQPGTVALDGQKNYNAVMLVSGVSNVVIKNLTIQWANSAGLYCYQCNFIEIANNLFKNSYIGAHDMTGNGMTLSGQDMYVHNNLIYGFWVGAYISSAPRMKFTHNTITATARVGLAVNDVANSSGSEFTYNTINLYGNHYLEILYTEANKGTIKIDYNNIGTYFQTQTIPKVDTDTNVIMPYSTMSIYRSREFIYILPLPGDSTTSRVYYSFSKWKSDTGYDTHSIFADPKWVDPASGKFNLKPDSPNLLPGGNYIGAFDTTMTPQNIPDTEPPPPDLDTTPPSLSNISVSSITPTSAVIIWTTDKTSSSQLSYGLTSIYGSQTGIDSRLVTSHSVTLSSLTPDSVYHFKAVSVDSAGNIGQSADVTFTTPKTNTPLVTPTNGICSGTINQCSSGTLNDTSDTDTYYLWQCLGKDGGVTASCSLNKPGVKVTLVNGSCSNSINQCSSGTLVSTSETDSSYLWRCAGSNGGMTASCSLNKQINAVQNITEPFTPLSTSPRPTNVFRPTNAPQNFAELPQKETIESFEITRHLKLGDEGQDVRLLQQTLNKIGYKVAVSGGGSPGYEYTTFDQNTKNALLKYQSDRESIGLTPSGELDSQTLTLINYYNGNQAVSERSMTPAIDALVERIANFFRNIGIFISNVTKGAIGALGF